MHCRHRLSVIRILSYLSPNSPLISDGIWNGEDGHPVKYIEGIYYFIFYLSTYSTCSDMIWQYELIFKQQFGEVVVSFSASNGLVALICFYYFFHLQFQFQSFIVVFVSYAKMLLMTWVPDHLFTILVGYFIPSCWVRSLFYPICFELTIKNQSIKSFYYCRKVVEHQTVV